MRIASRLIGLILAAAVLSVRCGTVSKRSGEATLPDLHKPAAAETRSAAESPIEAVPPASPAPAPVALVDFETQVRPILARCTPCHFEGGVMYERAPFDRPETVHRLGTKLFTRVKDEGEQATIRAFLEQGG